MDFEDLGGFKELRTPDRSSEIAPSPIPDRIIKAMNIIAKEWFVIAEHTDSAGYRVWTVEMYAYGATFREWHQGRITAADPAELSFANRFMRLAYVGCGEYEFR